MRAADSRILTCALCALLTLLLASPAVASPALHVVPFPGTPDASPQSQVIFSSLRPSEIRSVVAIGSTSGRHAGHLKRLPDAAGTSFVPEHPFTSGEHVSITAVLSSPAAGTASGDPGATKLSFSFGVAVPANAGTGAAGGAPASGSAGAKGLGWPAGMSRSSAPPTQSFHSEPQLHPPEISATPDPDRSSGQIFLATWQAAQNGPLILNSAGQLVWFRPVTGFATNLEVQHYRGQPVLTWWQQELLPGHVYSGTDVILSDTYRTIAMLHAGYGYLPNFHEFALTPRGTALIVAYPDVMSDLRQAGGSSDGAVLDCVIQELDVKSNRVLWEWHALGHVPVSASFEGHPGSPPYDYFHLNSIQELPNGNLLISARNTWAVYEIDKRTGRVIWSLGGKSSSFKMGAGTNFEWQHDAHLVGDTLTLFDDGAFPQEERQSSAKVLRLNTSTGQASLLRRYQHSPPLLAGRAGSTQILPNGNVFVGWGRPPDFAEYTPGGRQIFNGAFPLGVYSYRAYRFAWHARPAWPPALAVTRSAGGLTLYASWNGATGVVAWRVLGGRRTQSMSPLGVAHRTGFETTIDVSRRPREVAVQALNQKGRVLGTSRAVSYRSTGRS